MKAAKTIEQIESRLEEGLSKLRSPEYSSLETLLNPTLPKGYRVRVSLVDKSQRKKRKNASADNWSPETGEVRIYFEPDDQLSPAKSEAKPNPVLDCAKTQVTETKPASDPISDLVQALDRSESRPGYGFVALKWFRDVVLPAFEWARLESARQASLREAIEKRFVLTSKAPNPKSPEFPVTAIRLNRLLPEVQAILGQGEASDTEFAPIDIRGENLSETVLRERR